MRVKHVIFIFFLATLQVAHGDEITERARAHFDRATALYDVGRFADAAREYEAAYELKNDPALLFNLGQAYRYAENYSKAIFAYRGYLRRVPDADNRSEVEGYIAKSQLALQRQNDSPAVERPKTAAPSANIVAPVPVLLAKSQPAATPPPRRTPAYKKWWVWTVVGVVVAGAAVGVGLGLTMNRSASLTPVFPAVGETP
jgi:tetratricopeptide (TPR) repeat protein